MADGGRETADRALGTRDGGSAKWGVLGHQCPPRPVCDSVQARAPLDSMLGKDPLPYWEFEICGIAAKRKMVVVLRWSGTP